MPPRTYTTAQLFERFHPGLFARVAKSGAGKFEKDFDVPDPKVRHSGMDICHARAAFLYVYGDGNLLRIYTIWDLTPGKGWARSMYYLHYGPEPLDPTVAHFRVDLHEPIGHHVHLPPKHNEHIPPDEVAPNTRDMDPLAFVDLVHQFRATGTPPIVRKKK